MASKEEPSGDRASRSTAPALHDLLFPVRDDHLDAICRFLAEQCHVSATLITLVNGDQSAVVARSGPEWSGSASLCAAVMEQGGRLVIPDLLTDSRFTNGPGPVRFYAAEPLLAADGTMLGILSLHDDRPRAGLNDREASALRLMAVAVVDRLVLRQAREERAAQTDFARDASEWRFHTLADTMPQMVWSSRADGYCDYFNARWYAFTGLSEGASEGREWRLSLHPDDQERTTLAWHDSVTTGELYEIEYRLKRADGQYRWALARGVPLREESGQIVRWFGTCTDIHDHKIALEERELISQELSHRIKNIFAVISGLIGLSARTSPAVHGFAEALRDRVLALGRAHDFVGTQRVEQDESRLDQNSLQGLLRGIFSPYEADPGSRIVIRGDDVVIDDRSATPLALTFHEIVTNAAKYGALSRPEGTAMLIIRRGDDNVDLAWTESGGPAVTKINGAGFGTRLLDLSVRRQLGGSYEQNWNRDGLAMQLRIPASAFSRRSG